MKYSPSIQHLANVLSANRLCICRLCIHSLWGLACCWVACIAHTPVSAQTTSADWTSFRGNAQSSGFVDADAGDALVPAWKFKLADGGFESSAVIVETTDANKETSAESASVKTVFIAGLTNDVRGKLFALNLEGGKKKWEFDSEDGFITTPVYSDGKLYLGDMAGQFFCIDTAGKQQWAYKTEIEINSSANIYKDKVLFGSQDGSLYALNKDSGKLAWKHTTQDQIQCSVTVAGNNALLAGCDAQLHVINLDSGEETGSIKIGAPTIATPAARGDVVFFGNEKGDFFSMDCAEMKTLWKYQDELGGNSIRSSAALADEHVVVGARNRKLYSFDSKTGNENWSVTLKNKVDSSPMIVKNRVVVASTDGRLYLIDLENGSKLWEKQFNGSFTGSPAFAHGHVIIATDEGTVYALKFTTPE